MLNTFNIKNTYVEYSFNKGLIHGPLRDRPGYFFAKFITNHGTYEKILSIPQNLFLISALSSSTEDVLMRRKLREKFGLSKTLDIFKEQFPYSVRAYMANNENMSFEEVFEKILNKYS